MDASTLLALMNGNGGFGGNNFLWIIFLFFLYGWGGNGMFGRGNGLANEINNDYGRGLLLQAINGNGNAIGQLATTLHCDVNAIQTAINAVQSSIQSVGNQVGMSGLQTINAIQSGNQALASQLAQCCCEIREAVSGVNYNMATQANGISRQISDCCCNVERQIERGFADTNYNLATQNCATLTAIDKVGDRIIDYMANEKMQTLRDENQALRLAASQERQNQFLISQLGYQCPKPAYVVQPPQQVTFPTNCCGGVNYAGFNNGCGCGCN